MTFEQECAALNSLGKFSIQFRDPQYRIGSSAPFYTHHSGVEIKDRGFLRAVFGNGYTPEEATHDYWLELTERIKPHEYVVIGSYTDNRRAVRWDGFTWTPVVESR